MFLLSMLITAVVVFALADIANKNTNDFCLDLKDLDYNIYIKKNDLFYACYIDNIEITYTDYKQIKINSIKKWGEQR